MGCWVQGRRVLLQLMFVAAVRMDWVLWLRLLLLVVCSNEVLQMSWAAGACRATLEGDKAHAIAWFASSS